MDSHMVDQRTDIYALGMIIEDIVTNFNKHQNYDGGIKYIIEKCIKRNRDERFLSVAELRRSIVSVYNALLGRSETQRLEQDLIRLASNMINHNDIQSLALRVQSETDMELVERFISAISAENYKYFEAANLELAESMIDKLCSYWNQGSWPFSYIDSIADMTEKIFKVSSDTEIKAKLLYQLLDLAIYYNRWYAMGKAEKLLIGINDNIGVQAALETRLRDHWLDLSCIMKNINELPIMIKNLYEENAANERNETGKWDVFF